MPLAIEQFDFSGFLMWCFPIPQVMQRVLLRVPVRSMCAICTRLYRYAWDDCHKYVEDFGLPRLVKKAIPFYEPATSVGSSKRQSTDHIIANSQFVADRMEILSPFCAYHSSAS